jgi:hypothetical protein
MGAALPNLVDMVLLAFYNASGSAALEHLHYNLTLPSDSTLRLHTPDLGARDGMGVAAF